MVGRRWSDFNCGNGSYRFIFPIFQDRHLENFRPKNRNLTRGSKLLNFWRWFRIWGRNWSIRSGRSKTKEFWPQKLGFWRQNGSKILFWPLLTADSDSPSKIEQVDNSGWKISMTFLPSYHFISVERKCLSVWRETHRNGGGGFWFCIDVFCTTYEIHYVSLKAPFTVFRPVKL